MNGERFCPNRELRVLPGPGDPGTEGAFDPKELQSLVDNQFDVLPVSARHSRPVLSCLVLLRLYVRYIMPLPLLLYLVLQRSDRMAVCLGLSEDSSGSANLPVGGQQMSEACVSGTIQLPPDGMPADTPRNRLPV